MTLSHRDQRREPRQPAEGVVRVRLSNPQPLEISGQLIDVTTGGFRMAHGNTLLTAGQVVEFAYQNASGHARVVWTRIVAGKVESGFLVMAAGA